MNSRVSAVNRDEFCNYKNHARSSYHNYVISAFLQIFLLLVVIIRINFNIGHSILSVSVCYDLILIYMIVSIMILCMIYMIYMIQVVEQGT